MPQRIALAGFVLLGFLAIATVVVTAQSERPGVARLGGGGTDADSAALFGQRVADAALEAQALVALGESRSRNLFAITSAQGRMEDKLAAADALAAALPASPGEAPALAAYRGGATAVRAAMDDAQAAFLRLDWERVARAYDRLESGTARLTEAAAALGSPLPASPAP